MTAVEETRVLTRRERRALGTRALQDATENTTLMNKPTDTRDSTLGASSDFIDNNETDELVAEEASPEDAGTAKAEETTAQASTGPMPIMLPEELDLDDAFVDSSDEETSVFMETTEDSDSRFVGFDDDDFATVPVNENLDPAVAIALRNRSVDEIMLEEDCTTEEAFLIIQQEELLRVEYFQAEIPEKVEQLRREKEDAEKLQRETALAKKEAIASRATHKVKARFWVFTAMGSFVAAGISGAVFLALGGF